MFRTRPDTFTLTYSLLTLAGCVWWQARSALDDRFNLFLLILPVIWLPVVAIGIGLAVVLISHLCCMRWRRAASVLLAGLLAWSFLEWLPINSVDWMIFELNRPRYDASLTEIPGPAQSRIKAWLFRDEGGFGSFTWETYVVYDGSDEIALPAAQWSESWRSRAFDAGRPDSYFEYLARPKDAWAPSGFWVDRIRGHWYFVVLAF